MSTVMTARAPESSASLLLSIVIPVFNEEAVLPALYERLCSALAPLDGPYELVFVNDGSRDRTLEMLHELARYDARVKLVSFSRNFGHQIAISAGLDYSRGDAVVIIDADLQDPPELIPAMVERWRAGYEIVYAVREQREGESFFKRATASLYYRIIKSITQIDIPLDVGDFRLLGRRAVETLQHMRETHRYVRGMVSWVGFRQTGITYTRAARTAGDTKYPFRKMLKLAFDGITSFSLLPLKVATLLGMLSAVFSFLLIIWVVYIRLTSPEAVTGWASQLSIILFLGGVQLLTLGILGEYIGRIYDEVRRRPLYVVEETVGLEQPALSSTSRII